MTFIVKVSPIKNIFEQVKWKCKVYSSMFSTVLIVHILFSLLMFSNGAGNIKRGGTFIEYDERFYSLDILFIISIMTLFILGWSVANKSLSNANFSIISTNYTEAISSLLLIIILSIFTVASALSSLYIFFFIKLLMTNETMVIVNAWPNLPSLIIFVLGIILAGSVSYLAKSLFDFSKIVFVMVIVAVILLVSMQITSVFPFLFGVGWFSIILRCLLFIGVTWGLTIFVRQRKEVIRG